MFTEQYKPLHFHPSRELSLPTSNASCNYNSAYTVFIKKMAPSDSKEFLCLSVSSEDLEICSPINLASESSLDLRHLRTTCLPQNWAEADSVGESSDDISETADSLKALDFKDRTALGGDLRFILTIPKLCDVKFVVGRRKFPMYGVKAILASRSRVFFDMIDAMQNTDSALKWKGRTWLISQIKKLTKKDDRNSSAPLVLEIPDFEPSIFRHVLTFTHTGDINVSFDDVIGVMNAADVYGLDGLRSACLDFARQFVTQDAVLSLLASTEPYRCYKWTKLITLEILKFMCDNAQDVLRHVDFQKLSLQSAILVLSKPELRATEEVKWNAVLRWSVYNGGDMSNKELCDVLQKLSSGINFCDISLRVLKKEVRPLGFLPDDVINKAIYHQRSPRLIIGQDKAPATSQKRRHRRSATHSNEVVMTANFFHMQPLASSTFDSSRDFSDSVECGDSL